MRFIDVFTLVKFVNPYSIFDPIDYFTLEIKKI